MDDRRAFVDVGLRNCEPWAWPSRPGHSFVKAMEWELPHTDFSGSARTARKRREWEVFRALGNGGKPPRNVVEVVAPAGRHVIEHVRGSWLPGRPPHYPST